MSSSISPALRRSRCVYEIGRVYVFALAWFYASSAACYAQNANWTGAAASGYWTDAANWTGAPTGAETIQFNNTARPNSTNNLSGSAAVRHKMLFLSGTSARAIYGSTENTFVEVGGVAPQLGNFYSASQDVRFPFAVAAPSMQINPSNGFLYISSSVRLDGNELAVIGTNVLRFTATSDISGTGQLALAQNSRVTIAAPHSFTGGVYISGGFLSFSNGGSADNAKIYIGATNGTAPASLLLFDSSISSPILVRSNSTGVKAITSSSGSNVLSGRIDLETHLTINNSPDSTLTLNAPAGDLGTSALRVTAETNITIETSFTSAPGVTNITNFFKNGLGTLILSGTNQCSGRIMLEKGELMVAAGATSGEITISNDSKLTVRADSRAQSFLPSAIKFGLNNSPRLGVQLGTFNGSTNPLIVTDYFGDRSYSVTVSLFGGDILPGRIPFIRTKNVFNNPSLFLMTAAPPGINAIIKATNGTNLVIDIVSVSPSTWAGTIGTNWDINQSGNWQSDLSLYYLEYGGTGPSVLFNDSLTTAYSNIFVKVAVSPNSMTVSNRLKSYSFGGSGNIGGYGSLLKRGIGVATVNVGTSYRGKTWVREGTLIQNGTNSGGGTLIVDAGAVVTGSGVHRGPAEVSGSIRPGKFIGTFSSGAQQWLGGGEYVWELADGIADSGTGSDQLIVDGVLDVQASAGIPFTIKLVTLTNNAVGRAAFNNDQSYSWTIVSASNGVTGYVSNSLLLDTSRFSNDLAGGTFALETNGGLNLYFINNRTPVANNLLCTRSPGSSFKISITDLLASQTSDPDGDARELLSVSMPSAGGTLTQDANWLYYTPALSDADEVISYTVGDVRAYRAGDTRRIAIAQIQVTKAKRFGQAQTINVIAGKASVQFSGIPTYQYDVERSTNLVDWDFIQMFTTPGSGLFIFTDDTPPAESAYYRLREH